MIFLKIGVHIGQNSHMSLKKSVRIRVGQNKNWCTHRLRFGLGVL